MHQMDAVYARLAKRHPIDRRQNGQGQVKKLMTNKDVSIIIVDDMQFSRVVVQAALRKAGFSNILVASSAAEALKTIEEKHIEVVLADWVMPEMDGLELTDRIRQRDEEQ